MTDDPGTLYVVGIGPGLPADMTQRAAAVISSADCVIAADLYQAFLRQDGTLPPADADGPDAPDVVRSTVGRQADLAREAFERVRDGDDVAHVSGGDPNVYGKSDLLFTMAAAEDVVDVPIEVVPGVTAALGGASTLGAPLSNDFCTVSLSDRWRDWTEIETKLRTATRGGFVVVLYNPPRNYRRAIDVIREERSDDVPVAIFTDVGRAEYGYNPDGERHVVTTLGDAVDYEDTARDRGTSVLVGTAETDVWHNDYRSYLVTSRGGRDVDDF